MDVPLTSAHLGVIASAILAALAKQQPAPTYVPATVLAFDSGNNQATVAIDGDGGEPTDAANVTGQTLESKMRVLMGFSAPRGVFVIGVISPPAWDTYTPTVTGWASAVAEGAYTVRGDVLHLRASITATGATTFGSPTISLPKGVTPVDPLSANAVTQMYDSETASHWMGFAWVNGADMVPVLANGNTKVTATGPFTWSNGDSLHISLSGINVTTM